MDCIEQNINQKLRHRISNVKNKTKIKTKMEDITKTQIHTIVSNRNKTPSE
jgi:hypothetical protein